MSHERNRLSNGRFLTDLNNWTASGATFSVGDGDDHYGVAVLSTGGDYIEQTFSVTRSRLYSIHYSVKPVGAALSGSQATYRIQDGDGNTVITTNLVGATQDAWNETTDTVGLVSGTTYTLRITNASATGDIKLDDVWLWFVPVTRATIADTVNRKLARLASNRSLSTTASGTQTEGDFTDSVDAGLRTVGAISEETGLPDVRWLDDHDVNTVLDEVERYMLERLSRDYAVEVDIAVGPRRESLSQISRSISGMTGEGAEGGSSGPVVVRKLTRRADDYEFS